MSSAEGAMVGADDKRKKKIKKKNVAMMLQETSEPDDNNELNDAVPHEEHNLDTNGGQGNGELKDSRKNRKTISDEEAAETAGIILQDESSAEIKEKKIAEKKKKRKERLLKEASQADKRGICYLSRIPPHMDHVKLRQILSQHGEIKRIYLAPEDPAAQIKRKRGGGFRGQEFSEGWVEFTKKTVVKRVAKMLNGEQIGGRKRSQWYYDLWNIKYLSKFKWDDLTEEIAHKNAIREQKLAMELSAATRERDFYLSKVEQSRALAAMEERHKKKQKVGEDPGENSQGPAGQSAPKVICQFQQKRPVMEPTKEPKSRLSRDLLAGVFGAS
ncbi:hypothetical protein SAY87_025726 [Trapa incisa]|uniref:RRM domain-containing protein n=1 Tax=Trapa incisa TaxID=236973 RepID=A0AAN7GQY4_9MYRT|nr:hypothetical protein SAY87_025726 [Trapa incisa]